MNLCVVTITSVRCAFGISKLRVWSSLYSVDNTQFHIIFMLSNYYEDIIRQSFWSKLDCTSYFSRIHSHGYRLYNYQCNSACIDASFGVLYHSTIARNKLYAQVHMCIRTLHTCTSSHTCTLYMCACTPHAHTLCMLYTCTRTDKCTLLYSTQCSEQSRDKVHTCIKSKFSNVSVSTCRTYVSH